MSDRSVRAVCVFCSSSTPPDRRYVDAAVEVAAELATRGLTLVYGGGRVGLMGVIADAALARGVRVEGVMPAGLFSREVAHTGLTELHQVGSMHERKKLMYDLADGFVALPGGLGTLEELAEVATWTQLGLHAKPVVLLDMAGFWQPLLAQLDRMVDDGFLKPENRAIVRAAKTVPQALDLLAQPTPFVEKWLDDEER